MSYKETAEYAFDLMEHFYKLHENQILCLGAANLKVMVPTEIYNLLEVKNKETEKMNVKAFPARYRKMDMYSYPGSTILFALKEIK